ncbi:MAG: hypothetical protein KGJ60_09485 [Verrucomicrobiota bacterium]|nr:hypothetical protein [Verrucomicrobiota bacterium]
MTLVLLLLVPIGAGLLCLATSARQSWEWINLLAFAALVPLALQTGAEALANGVVSALHGSLRADALSALVLLLTVFMALAGSIYSIGYFRDDVRAARISDAQVRRYYVLTPLFVAAMLLVPLADNLGIMWVAIEGATLASVLLVTFYNQKTSFEAGWKYIIIGSIGISLALFGTLPWTGGFFLLALTGTPPFSIFQSEFTTLSAALADGRGWTAFLFIAGLVAIFAGFLMHMARMNLGEPPADTSCAASPLQRFTECPWKLGAMALLAAPVVALGFWIPNRLFRLVQKTVQILGGAT